MKNNVLRTLIIAIALTIAMGTLGLSGAQRKADSQALTVPAQVTAGLPDNEEVDAATALTWLREGNVKWRTTMARRNWADERIRTSSSQKPFAVVMACMDSRVPPELIFDRGLGEIFVIRVAGPVLNADELASLEYAVGVMNVKLVLVLGHTDCGAVKSAVTTLPWTREKPPIPSLPWAYLPELLDKIEPAIGFVGVRYNEGRRITVNPNHPSNEEKTNLSRVSSENARIVADRIRSKPSLRQPGVKVTWGLYYLRCGEVVIEPNPDNVKYPEPDPCPPPRPR